MKKIVLMSLITLFVSSCASFKASRDDAKKSDEKAMEVTDNWMAEDTRQTVQAILKQMKTHKGWQKYLRRNPKSPKLFIAEVQNNTSEAYFPIDDFNDEFLYEISSSGEFRLVDAAARDKILQEITYQNDGMVDPAQAKTIGKQLGADLMIFGAVHMKPEKRNGKTIKQYSVNLRLTDIETSEEVLRTRHRIYKSSDKNSYGW